MAKSPEEMLASQIANIEKNTGKKMDEWISIASKSGKTKHREIINWLKSEHGFTYGNASLVAAKTRELASGNAPASGDELVEAQYAGPKAALRSIYDDLIAIAKGFGDDLEISPKKTYVSLRRNKQFAIIQASTKTRVDLGLNLKGREPEGLFEAAGSWNSMCSHRMKITDAEQIDENVKAWMKAAYEAS